MNKDYYNNWYQIEEFPNGPYEINKMGQIRNKRTKNILKPQIKNAGYLVYTLYIDRKIYYRQAHILVARQFTDHVRNLWTFISQHQRGSCQKINWRSHLYSGNNQCCRLHQQSTYSNLSQNS